MAAATSLAAAVVASGAAINAAHAPRKFVVTESGARGDGLADDTAAIQSSIDACIKARYGCVYFPPGRYRVTKSLRMQSSEHIDLIGEGRSSILLHENDEPLFLWPENVECIHSSVRDLHIAPVKNNKSPSTAAFALLGGVARSHFANLVIRPADASLMGSGVITRKVADTTTFDHCLLWGVTGVGLELARGSEIRIFGARIVGHNSPTVHGQSRGIYLTGDNGGVHIVTTDLIGMETALRIGDPHSVANREVFLTHCTIDSCTHGLVQCDHAYTSIAGCWAASCDEEQILLDKEAIHANLVISGGTIFNGGAYGRGGANNGLVVRAGTFTLSGVEVRYNKGTGILIESDNVQGFSVTGCRIHSNGTGAALRGNAYSFQNNILLRNRTQLVDEGGPEKIVQNNLFTNHPEPHDPYMHTRAKRETT